LQTVTGEVVNTFSVETQCYDDWQLILEKYVTVVILGAGSKVTTW